MIVLPDFDMVYSEVESSSSQDELSLYAVLNLRDCPKKLLKRDSTEGQFSCHFSLPLPSQIVIFALGKWDSYADNCEINIEVSLDSEPCYIGTLTKENTCICWSKTWSKTFQNKSKEIYEQDRLAKLMASITEVSSVEEKENRSDSKKLFYSVEDNHQFNSKHEKSCETPKTRTPKQQKLNFSGGKQNYASTQGTRTADAADDAIEANSDRGSTPQERSVIKVFGKKRRSISNSPARKRRKSVPNGKHAASPTNGVVASPRLPTPPVTPKHSSEAVDGPSGRWGHAVAVLGDQKVLMVGGQGMKQEMVKDSLWLLDTGSNSWKEQVCDGGGADRRMGHTVTYDPETQLLYVFGGSKNKRWFSDVNVLDTQTWTWSAVEANGQAPKRAYHSCTWFHGELFVFGGVFPNPVPEADSCSNELFTFNPSNSYWYKPIVCGDVPLPRSGHSASLLGDRLIIFGGWDAPLICFNDLYILDMGVNLEYSKPTVTGCVPSPRSWHAVTNLSCERIFIHGGFDGDKILADSFIFELETLTWTGVQTPSTLNPRAGHVTFCLTVDDDEASGERVAIFGGGNNAGGYFNDYITFTPKTA